MSVANQCNTEDNSFSHIAPPGQYIVGLADLDQDSWVQLGEPYSSLADASAEMRRLHADHPHELYSVYDEHGLVDVCICE